MRRWTPGWNDLGRRRGGCVGAWPVTVKSSWKKGGGQGLQCHVVGSLGGGWESALGMAVVSRWRPQI